MRWAGLWLALLFILAGCATSRPSRVERIEGSALSGQASWYGRPHHGRRTSSGEIYDMNKLTAAHRTLPLGTRLLVTNRENGRTVEVRINDRGPFRRDRVLDLSYAAARQLGAVADGVIPVTFTVVTGPGAD
jgi:rare lipoprotein A